MQSPLAGSRGLGPRGPRNLVLLLDGTGNQFGSTNSNIIKLMSVFAIDEDQIVFYSSGVGTWLPQDSADCQGLSFPRQRLTLRSSSRPSRLDGPRLRHCESRREADGLHAMLTLSASNFETFVCDAYKFLMDYYQTGDKVYILGFSRGAYTARAVAGMVQKVGNAE